MELYLDIPHVSNPSEGQQVVGTYRARAVTPPPPVPSASGDGKVRTFWIHTNSTPVTDATIQLEAKRRTYIVLNSWEGDLCRKLKAANPAVQVFVYKDLSSTRSYHTSGVDLPTGVDYFKADPSWFLKSSGGYKLIYQGYSGHYQMDIGNVGYQEAWATNVLADVKAKGFDGVWMDNALFGADTYHPGIKPVQYQTDASFQAAYVSMLKYVRSRLTGVKTIANLSNARLYSGVWTRYMEHLDGGFDEWWVAFDNSNLLAEYTEGWVRQVDEVTANEAAGKITLVQPHFDANGMQAFMYSFCSYLIANGTKAAYSALAATDGYGDPTPWRPEFTKDYGAPLGRLTSPSPNVFKREFEHATVTVNANKGVTTGTITMK